ncbi:MAG: phosphatidylglycerophosphatase A [Planctomycetota bacterium]|nr:phosphatidylglycerophosphatase A [Planctomycetota bacterium]MDI6787369.1 phosphatidylglycerophosphatase A [Planctomycetota bacterium]
MKKRLLLYLVSMGYAHHLPFLKGTFGTLGATLLYFLVYFTVGSELHIYFCLILFVIFTIVSYLTEPLAQSYLGNDDPPSFIIDEWAGFFGTILFLPPQINWIIYGFIAFRFFDIVKPPPLRRLEKIRGGIVWDDIGAAIYAGLTLQVVRYLITI